MVFDVNNKNEYVLYLLDKIKSSVFVIGEYHDLIGQSLMSTKLSVGGRDVVEMSWMMVEMNEEMRWIMMMVES